MAKLDLKNCTVRFKDGGVIPRWIEASLTEAAFTWTETRNIEYTPNRGKLDSLAEVREGDEVPMEVSFELNFTYLTSGGGVASSGSTATAIEALKGKVQRTKQMYTKTSTMEGTHTTSTATEAMTNEYTATAPVSAFDTGITATSVEDFDSDTDIDWISTDPDPCRLFAIDIEIVNAPSCGTNRVSETFIFPDFRFETLDYDLKAATISVKGKCFAKEPIIFRKDY